MTHHRSVVVHYDITDGKIKTPEITKTAEWLVGDLNPPTLTEVRDLVNKNVLKFFSSYLANYITEFNGIKEIKKENYDCYQCDHFVFLASDMGKSVKFKVLVDYSYLDGINLVKAQDEYEIYLLRDGIKQPWKDFPEGTAHKAITRNTLEKITLSSEEQNYFTNNTLSAKVRNEKAVSYYNNLPKVEIPKFNKAMDMAWWLHKFLRKAKPAKVEYVMLTKLSSFYFLNNENYILNENGLNLVETIKKIVSRPRGNYGDHYCEVPEIKHQQGDDANYMVQFYPKYGETFSRIAVAKYEGEFKIKDIQLSVYSEKKEVDAVMNAPADKCKENIIALWGDYNLKEYQIKASFPAEPTKVTFPDKPKKIALVLQLIILNGPSRLKNCLLKN